MTRRFVPGARRRVPSPQVAVAALLAVLAACGGAKLTPRSAVNLAGHSLADYDESYTRWFEHEATRVGNLHGAEHAAGLDRLADIEERYYVASQAAYAALVAARTALAEGRPVGDDLDAAVALVARIVAELASGGP